LNRPQFSVTVRAMIDTPRRTIPVLGRRALLGLGVLALARPALAAYDPNTDPLVGDVRAYLAALTTLKATFLQVNHTGDVAEGVVYLARPDRLRFEYRQPQGLLVVANGASLRVYDPEIDTVTELPFSDTPASLILREDVDLGGTIQVVSVGLDQGVLTMAMVQRDNPGLGSLSVLFQVEPLELKQWTVVDAQGLTTRVTLFDTQTGLPLDPALFDLARLPLTPAPK
jgi:outer membrane lipoprotein-sorting protein